MRRVPLGKHTFTGGFNDSQNPLEAQPNQWADGSCNQVMLGEGFSRPFGGYFTQGAGTGSRLMFSLGSVWGGLRDYSTVTALGNILEDYSGTLFAIGAGEVTRTGIPVSESAIDFTFVAGDVTVSPLAIAETSHGLTTGEPVYITNTAGDPPLGISENVAYFAININANTFSLASTYKNALAGTRITVSDAGTGTNTVHGDNGGLPIRASSVLQVGYNKKADYFYEYVESAGLARVDTPTVNVPSAPSPQYLGQISGVVQFKIAAIRDTANVGVDLDTPSAPVKGLASTSSVIVNPTNNTVNITFPTAVTGQTHWAMFSTLQGFGGTGAFYRLGWRLNTNADAEWFWGVSEATVAASPTRTLEFDFLNGDLLPETAWLQDYEPPPGSHCVRLENIMVVLGAFDGTVGAVSLPNFFESYNPFHLLYFPEPVTAVLSRQIDNYAFVATRNGVYTVQYVGYRGDELPSATVTTISPEVGVAYQHNWCIGGGNIAMFIEGAGIALMRNDGTIDYEFGREVAKFTRTWTAADTKAVFNPTTRSFVFGNGTVSVSFCLESGVWGSPVYNTDAGVAEDWLSGINAQGKLYVSLTDKMTEPTAFVYDDATTTTRMPICSTGQWIVPQGTGRGNAIYEIASAIDQGSTGALINPAITVLHKNLFRKYVRGCSTTSGSSTLTAPSGTFTNAWTGKVAVVTGTAIGGANVHYLIVRLTVINATTASMANVTTGSAVNAQATLSNVFVLIGEYAFAQSTTVNCEQHLSNLRPAIQNARSYCVSLYQGTDALRGACFEVDIFGTPQRSSRVAT